jgi:YD repeat-containing protein
VAKAFLEFVRRIGLAAVCSAFACLGAIRLQAEAVFTWKFEPHSIGSADRYGYAIWAVPLAELTLDGAKIPLRAEFSTDPRPSPSPSPLGRGWSINFFSSALVEVDQDSIRWHRPDKRIFFFILERGNAIGQKRAPGDPLIFISKDASWTATKIPKQRFITLRHSESGAEFVYEDGLLVRFSFGDASKGSERYSISYNSKRRPARLAALGSGKLLAEFLYENAELAKGFRLGENRDPAIKSIAFEYAPASLNQFELGPYLSRIEGASLSPLGISYAIEGAESNRISFEKLTTRDTESLAWDGRSGFIREDKGGVYDIENPSLADGGRPARGPKNKSQVTDFNWRPDEARVTRTNKEGKSEFRFYDRSKGILTQKSSLGTTVTSYLLSPGKMYGKPRKIEQFINNQVQVTRYAYDERGNMIRRIDPSGDVIIREYQDVAPGVQLMREIKNQNLTSEMIYVKGRILSRKIYTSKGVMHRENKRLVGELTDNALTDIYRKANWLQ